MSALRRAQLTLGFAVAVALALCAVAPATAAPAPAHPAWSLHSLAAPTVFAAGGKDNTYEVRVANIGGKETDRSTITITDTLPKGLGVEGVEFFTAKNANVEVPGVCKSPTVAEVTTVTCKVDESLAAGTEPALLYPSEAMRVEIHVSVPAGLDESLENQVAVEGGGADPVELSVANEVDDEGGEAKAGLQVFSAEATEADGSLTEGAATHPYQYTTSFAVNTVLAPPGSSLPYIPAEGDLREIEVALPPGLIASPTATEFCSAQEFNTIHSTVGPGGVTLSHNDCPEGSVVGLAVVEQFEGAGIILPAPIYSLAPPFEMPAQFGLQPAVGAPIYIDTRLRSEGDYGASAIVREVTEAKRVTAGSFSFWGTPAAKSHDRLRGKCVGLNSVTGFSVGECEAGIPEVPSFRLPSSCADPLLTTMSFTTWLQPPAAASTTVGAPAPVGCAVPDFSPRIQARPTTNLADSPSGLHFNLHLPQKDNQDPEQPGEADLRDTTVTLPRGLAVNPSSADGLAACSTEQIGLTSAPGQSPIHFDRTPARCPAAAKIASAEATTPLLDHPVKGGVYLATQEDNPFKSLLALYFVLEDPQSGTVVKLAGKVSPDPVSGQLTTTVTDSPQVPIEDFSFDFFGGPRAPLRTPALCGPHTTTSEMVPWSAPAGPTEKPADTFQISGGPAGPCPSGALDPHLAMRLANPTAATYSPFLTRLTRADASAEFAGLAFLSPLGLSAKLAGIPYCPEAAIAAAKARSGPGQGALERTAPSCPAASRVGTTTAGAGAGPTPFYTSAPIYLAGPYKGALLSLVAVIPAVAGPFDLGVITTRIALHINPETGQVSALSDPLPTILSGIPLDVREIRANLDRPGFTLAPTNCEAQTVGATVVAPNGGGVNVTDRFQIGGCAALGFKPQISLKLSGGTGRNAHPALRATVTYPKGAYANAAQAVVTMPPTQQIDNAHIQNPCTRVQFNAHSCPQGSILGYARAFTPLLDQPLEGPVYFRSNGGERLLPDIVADLGGQIHAVAVGFVDSIHRRIRTTFATIPDAPLSKVVISLKGGKHGLLVNNRNICAQPYRAAAKLIGHNGKVSKTRPLLKNSCG